MFVTRHTARADRLGPAFNRDEADLGQCICSSACLPACAKTTKRDRCVLQQWKQACCLLRRSRDERGQGKSSQSINQSINRSIDQFVCLSVCFFSLIARGCQPSIPSPSARPDGAACACPGDLLRCCRGCLDPVSRGGGDLERGLQGRGEDDRGDIDQQLCATDDLHGSAHSAADGVRIGVCVCVCGLLRLQTRRRTSKQRDDAS